MNRIKPSGFTFTELTLVVIALTVVSAIAFTGYINKEDRAKHARLKSNMFDVQMAVEEFRMRAGGFVYPGNLKTRIIKANPTYSGDEPDLCVAATSLPPYGSQSILGEHVRNPFNPLWDALSYNPGVPVGKVCYEASNTPGDDPLVGPWTEAGDGPAIIYRITGFGKMGVLPLLLISSP